MSASSPQFGLPTRLPLLGLYPAKYRAANGAEIAAVLSESLEGADRRTVLREWATVAAHAVRLRTRLSSSDPAGRFLAGAAPYLLAGGAGLAVVHLLLGLFLPDQFGDEGHPALRVAVGAVQTVPWILALLCAAGGRWGAARLLVLAGTLMRTAAAAAFFAHESLALFQYLPLAGFWLLLSVLLLAPPDGVDHSRRARTEMVATALALALPMGALAMIWPWPDEGLAADHVFSDANRTLLDVSTAWPAVVMSIALLLNLARRGVDRVRAAGVALAVLPWTAMLAPPYYWRPPFDGHDLLRNLLVVLALLAFTATVAATRHRVRPSVEPVEPA
ncbi:hypothetical protein [Streptomyces sp. CB01881]|uniref:hypothetical protein n=1 Tax=Streptomyces sp. CB01881 TaxID=2078691 RepID=UPI000CDC137F|nr:hypothetical protein [Streptomyces sp. CB01881]AUY50931.1 hypothetical protein C2142_20540 [Streptomyces sp. CB01881]TYC74315.1 hypothetical protein EH183_20505 [Streptomyces sp. CB01881]